MTSITLPLGATVETWSGAIELQVNGEGELQVSGPIDYQSWNDSDDDNVFIRLSTVGIEDREYDETGANVSLSLSRDDAEQLATVLSELAQADPERFGEVIDE